MNFRDVELLSSYLDGQLNPSDSARLEARLSADKDLREVMDDLREARGLLRRLPQRRAPRNFTLTPKMAGLKAPEPRAYPVFRLATVLAAFLFLVSIAVNGFAPLAASRLAAAPAPVYGIGGGGGGGGPAESATAAEAQAQPFSAIAPTQSIGEATAEAAAPQDSARNLVEPTLEAAPKFAPQAVSPVRNEVYVPLAWQILLAIAAAVCGGAAWALRARSERAFRKRWNQK
jgi:anti-sigma factor RsiW